LTLILELKLAPAVGKVDDDQWFDEQRGTARGNVVDDAPHFAPEIGLDWDHIAAVPQGHDRFLGRGAASVGSEEVLETSMKPVVSDANVAADQAETGAGAINDLAALVDRAVNL